MNRDHGAVTNGLMDHPHYTRPVYKATAQNDTYSMHDPKRETFCKQATHDIAAVVAQKRMHHLCAANLLRLIYIILVVARDVAQVIRAFSRWPTLASVVIFLRR